MLIQSKLSQSLYDAIVIIFTDCVCQHKFVLENLLGSYSLIWSFIKGFFKKIEDLNGLSMEFLVFKIDTLKLGAFKNLLICKAIERHFANGHCKHYNSQAPYICLLIVFTS